MRPEDFARKEEGYARFGAANQAASLGALKGCADEARRDAGYDSGYATDRATARTTIHRRIEQALAAYEVARLRAVAAQRAQQILAQHPEYAELLDALSEF